MSTINTEFFDAKELLRSQVIGRFTTPLSLPVRKPGTTARVVIGTHPSSFFQEIGVEQLCF